MATEDIPTVGSIPDVEITESPDQNESQQEESVSEAVDKQSAAEVEAEEERVEEEVEEREEEEVSAVRDDVAEDVEPPSILTTDAEQDSLVVDSFGHDRREKDLEHYCMDREESDLMEDPEPVHDHQVDSLKPREERSRSPSRSIGPDIPEYTERREPSETPDTDTTEEVDTLRPREERSQAPSRSPEPVEQLEVRSFLHDAMDVLPLGFLCF